MKRYSRLTFLLPWFICALGAIFYAYEYFLRITPSVMTGELTQFFNIDAARLGNLSAFYYYIYTPMQLFVGVLMDHYGPRRLLTLASLCCVAGTLMFAGTHSLALAQVGRFLVGFGSAFAFVGMLKLATIWLPKRYFALFAGCATALGMLGGVAGDIALSHLVDMIGWKQTVYFSAYAGVFLAILIGLFVRDDNTEERRKAIAMRTVTWSNTMQGLWRIVKMPQMWVVGLIGGLMYIPTDAFAELWGIPYLQHTHEFTRQQAAFAVSMIYWGWVFGGPLAGWISDTIQRRKILLNTCPVVATALILAVLLMPTLSLFDISAIFFLFGVFSAAQILVFAVGNELNTAQNAGTAVAFVNMMVMIGGVVFQPLIGYFLDITNVNYNLSLMVLPIGLLLSAILSVFFLRETFQQDIANNKKKPLADDAHLKFAESSVQN